MTEMYLRCPGSTYSACWSFTKSKTKIQKFKETEDSRYIYKNDLEKVCFQHDMGYGDFNDLSRRATSDKVLCEKAFAGNPMTWACINGLLEILVLMQKQEPLRIKNWPITYINLSLEKFKGATFGVLILKTCN